MEIFDYDVINDITLIEKQLNILHQEVLDLRSFNESWNVTVQKDANDIDLRYQKKLDKIKTIENNYLIEIHKNKKIIDDIDSMIDELPENEVAKFFSKEIETIKK